MRDVADSSPVRDGEPQRAVPHSRARRRVDVGDGRLRAAGHAETTQQTTQYGVQCLVKKRSACQRAVLRPV